MKRFTSFLLISALALLLMASLAVALPARVNITMSETVSQNVTFAENFDLVEVTDFCTIEGILNVSNPSPDTVNDIYLNYTFTANMNTSFIYSAGRTGLIISSNNGTNKDTKNCKTSSTKGF